MRVLKSIRNKEEKRTIALVGYTGFVGSNIYISANGKIDSTYNSKNISEAFGTKPELLIYSGLRAEKYLANNNADKDMELIKQAEFNIAKINPKRLVLISTIDVFKTPVDDDNYRSLNNLDEVTNAYRYYKVYEYICQNYRPLCRYANVYAVWCLYSKYDEYHAQIERMINSRDYTSCFLSSELIGRENVEMSQGGKRILYYFICGK